MSSKFVTAFQRFAEFEIEAAIDPEVKAIRDEIMPWAGAKAKVYAMWLHKHSKKGESLEDIIPLAKFHFENINKLQGKEKDILSFKSPGELQIFLEKKFRSEEDDLPPAEPVTVIDGWKLYFPKSEEESCSAAGPNTTWCTARRQGENLFYNYALGGINLIYAESPNGEKYSLGYKDGKLMESRFGGATVRQDNKEFDPEEVIPPNVLAATGEMGKVPNPVREEVEEKLQTPEGVKDLFENKRYDSARLLGKQIRKEIPHLLSEDKESYITSILNDKLRTAIKTLSIYNYKDKFRGGTYEQFEKMKNWVSSSVMSGVTEPVSLEDHLGFDRLNILDFNWQDLPPLTKKSFLQDLKYSGIEIPEGVALEPKLQALADLDIEEENDKLNQQIINKPKQVFNMPEMGDEEFLEIRKIFPKMTEGQIENILNLTASRSPKEVQNFFKTYYDYMSRLPNEKEYSHLILRNLDKLLDKLREKPGVGDEYIVSEAVERLFDQAAKNNLTEPEDIKKALEADRKFNEDDFHGDLFQRDTHERTFILLKRFFNLSKDNLSNLNPRMQKFLLEKNFLKENNIDMSWANEPYYFQLEDDEERYIKDTLEQERQDELAKQRLEQQRNVEDYEEDWLDDRYVASFEDFADDLLA